jgi:CDP-glycerol glycerophosphotransferase (TagB/SpsB family)
MVLSGLIIKFPYWCIWQIRRVMGKLSGTVFYVESLHDYHIIEYILPHLHIDYKIIAKNRHVAHELNQEGMSASIWPVFPEVVIMARHAFHRFPIKGIRKIGLRHGPYHFKKFINPKKYNQFDLYLFTSKKELSLAQETGINIGRVGGYPRIDSLKNPQERTAGIRLFDQSKFEKGKKTLLFTSTWDQSGLSAIDRWINDLEEIKNKFNLFVSLHPMMRESVIKKIHSYQGICIVNAKELPAAMLMADFLVSDTSSVIAEFCALDKPIVTFNIPVGGRLTPEIHQMICDISVRINNLEEIDRAVDEYLAHPEMKKAERGYWNKVVFDDLNSLHGLRAAKVITEYLCETKL